MRASSILLVLALLPVAAASQGSQSQAPRTFTADAWSLKLEQGDGQQWGSSSDFKRWFPRGLVLGDADGVDGDGHGAVVLRSPEEVVAALANKPRAGAVTLRQDRPSSEGVVLGRLGRQVLVARLNLANDAKNVGADLEEYTFRDPAPPALHGLTVRQVLGFANRAFAGQYGHPKGEDGHLTKLVDVDGDGSADLSLTDLARAVEQFNASFSRDHDQPAIVVAPGAPREDGGPNEPRTRNGDTTTPVGTPPIIPGSGGSRQGRQRPRREAPVPSPRTEEPPVYDDEPRPRDAGTEAPAPGRPRNDKAHAEWERERRKASEEYERELRKAEQEATRENKWDKYERKSAELRAKYEEKLAKADRKYAEKGGRAPSQHDDEPMYDRDVGRMRAMLERTREERDHALEEVERLREENRRLREALDQGPGGKGKGSKEGKGSKGRGRDREDEDD